VRERVRGYSDAVFEACRDLAALAGELAGFAGLLASVEDLRVALSNPTLSTLTRVAVVHDLLSGKVSPQAVELLAFAAQNGSAGDYADDVAALARAAGFLARGMKPASGPLGHLGVAERLDGYATAVLGRRVRSSTIRAIQDELAAFMQVVEGNGTLLQTLSSPELPAQLREAIVVGLLAKRARTETARMAEYAARVGRPRDYLRLLEVLVERMALEADHRVAEVRAAGAISERQRRRLAAVLGRAIGHDVELRVSPDARLLGGFVATIGDTVVDASLHYRLTQARELLAMPPRTAGIRPPAEGRGGARTSNN